MNDILVQITVVSHLISTIFMTGVIWFVQIVHYPLFARVGESSFTEYERSHTRLTTWVVAPPMLVEAATAVLLVWLRPSSVTDLQVGIGLALVATNWLSTALLQVPCHTTLTEGFNAAVIRRLVSTNWIRTSAWSLRGILVVSMMLSGISTS